MGIVRPRRRSTGVGDPTFSTATVRGFSGAVLATAVATTVAFMGIGVVDPILGLIGQAIGASPSQIELLFTSYIAVMALAMLVAGALATRWGGRKTLLAGLMLVVVCATLSGLSNGIPMLAAARAGWGLGNALFTATALSIMVGSAAGSVARAITLYEAALGLGIAAGPLVGGFLGGIRWQYPFFATALLMAGAAVAAWLTVREPPREARRGLGDVVRALGHRDVLTNALLGLAYSYGFFTIMAYSPLALRLRPLPLGLTFFFWGLLLAFGSVVLANWLRPRAGTTPLLAATLTGLVLEFAGLWLIRSTGWLLVLVVLSGLFCGLGNALFTSLAIEVSPFSRSVSSGSYNFLRWAGAALAPVLSGFLAELFGPHLPFAVSGALLLVATLVLLRIRGRVEAAVERFRRQEEARFQELLGEPAAGSQASLPGASPAARG